MSAHDRPTASELIESVREWLERDVLPSVEGRLGFHTRVAMNSLDMVIRELESQETDHAVHADVLSSLGVASDEELAHRIREGHFDDALAQLVETLRPVIENKVRVANPKYLQ
jgi:hypothetical protein